MDQLAKAQDLTFKLLKFSIHSCLTATSYQAIRIQII